MASQTEENYLKALFSLSGEGDGGIRVSDLSHALGVSLPTANSMVKNLQTQGLIRYEKYKPLYLTRKGRVQAALIVRKHRLTEMYLVEKMGFGWEEVHPIAEQVEHIDSVAFFERMDQILGHPTVDPHGSPIPDRKGNIVTQAYRPMSSFGAGDKVRLAGLSQSSGDLLKFLNECALTLGMEVEILSVEAYDKSMTLRYASHDREIFSEEICTRLLVTPL